MSRGGRCPCRARRRGRRGASSASASASATARHRPGARLRERVDGLSLEELHDQEDGAVLGHVVVEHAHDARVVDAVRGVALAEEALAELGDRADRRVEDLDGAAHAVPVRRGVDRGHPADAEEPLEAPLVAQRRADPCLRRLHDGIDAGGGHVESVLGHAKPVKRARPEEHAGGPACAAPRARRRPRPSRRGASRDPNLQASRRCTRG